MNEYKIKFSDFRIKFLDKLISDFIWVYIVLLAFLLPFFTIPLTIITLVIVGFIFQNLYNTLKKSLYTKISLELLSYIGTIFVWYFFKLYFSISSPYYYLILSIPIGLSIYEILIKIDNKITSKKLTSKNSVFDEKNMMKLNYLSNSKIAFSLLLLGFIIAWFSSGVLDFITGYLSLSSIFSLGYFSPDNPLMIFFDFISAFATVTSSVWFMITMGIWLGVLAIFRLIEVKNTENKIRIFLMIFAYAFYSTWLPSFSPLANKVQYIPYMWFNGLGTYGPVLSSYLLDGIIGTFIVTAILSLLFGGRQICSVTCTAPFMLQGTFQDSLKKYNRMSKMGRKTLTSKLASWYKVIMIITWSSLIIFGIISFLNSKGITNITFFGNDPTVFYVMLYFNFIWYFQFFLMPFVGNYACVNHGVCAWGSYNQLFGYLGFFKLKAVDPKQCLSCKTVDCANACPVGLTDMRSSFIKRGEFKSFKCVGVGDCVEACPHNNILFYDVRNAIKEKLKK
ncbi:4Fe-4S binding protein [Acidianus manzaensis]|uniref:4Fe-4S ferredoxin n=1 Tax=Acidianus manzaensis TaxID=282676 RepID=A0A1W6K2P3_9CREN|nr:4Fe-4S binding protein [Acidianus manzaensis]ARM76808.1 4Fe-4S ferredoxin [Acidianus manzaensis]